MGLEEPLARGVTWVRLEKLVREKQWAMEGTWVGKKTWTTGETWVMDEDMAWKRESVDVIVDSNANAMMCLQWHIKTLTNVPFERLRRS